MTTTTRQITEVGDQFKTTDLALATVLSIQGMGFKLESGEGNGQALFVFTPLTPNECDDLYRTLVRYDDGEARVEPLSFLREVKQVRERLYAFLDHRDGS